MLTSFGVLEAPYVAGVVVTVTTLALFSRVACKSNTLNGRLRVRTEATTRGAALSWRRGPL